MDCQVHHSLHHVDSTNNTQGSWGLSVVEWIVVCLQMQFKPWCSDSITSSCF
jgi:hypothetical protein